LGDNRDSSSDSHTWGPVPTDAIVGKAWISYWPPNHLGFVPHYSYAATE
jgi:signal peptidase I